MIGRILDRILGVLVIALGLACAVKWRDVTPISAVTRHFAAARISLAAASARGSGQQVVTMAISPTQCGDILTRLAELDLMANRGTLRLRLLVVTEASTDSITRFLRSQRIEAQVLRMSPKTFLPLSNAFGAKRLPLLLRSKGFGSFERVGVTALLGS
jgi:hypothetical protein